MAPRTCAGGSHAPLSQRKSSCEGFSCLLNVAASSCVAFPGLLDVFSPPFSKGKWSLREAAYLATACCRFDRRFSPSPRSVHYLRMYRPQFSAEKVVAFSMCTLYRQWDSDAHPGLFTKNRSSDCSLTHPRPVRFCLLVCLWM